MQQANIVGEERRSDARIHFEVEVSLDSESHFFTGMMGDLSRGGVFIATYRPLAVGDELHLRFVLPTGTVDARGQVRWLREATSELGPGAGVSFDDLGAEARAAIERFCDERPPLYYEVGDRISEVG